jgi:hypothetical protein
MIVQDGVQVTATGDTGILAVSRAVSDLNLIIGAATITTTGSYSTGVYGSAEGTAAVMLGANIHTSGDQSQGLYVAGNDLSVTAMSSAEIVTEGSVAPGISVFAENSATVLVDGSVHTSGYRSEGLYAIADDISVTVTSRKALGGRAEPKDRARRLDFRRNVRKAAAMVACHGCQAGDRWRHPF